MVGGTSSGDNMAREVREEVQGTGIAIVRPIAP